ncbi:MAG: DNA-processing protein DprA, partial [Butyricimonas faecihominis]
MTRLEEYCHCGNPQATEMGKKRVDTLLHELAETGYHLNIISGLAYGIDITAHTACIHYGLKHRPFSGTAYTWFILPHTKYGRKFWNKGGALISEFPTCAQILPTNFLQRNRIVAGMSEAILVAESPIKGGAMSTARQALSYNRDVMAIPGRPEDPTFAGCNLLIKQNIAALVENIKDLIRILNWPPLPTGPYQMSLD